MCPSVPDSLSQSAALSTRTAVKVLHKEDGWDDMIGKRRQRWVRSRTMMMMTGWYPAFPPLANFYSAPDKKNNNKQAGKMRKRDTWVSQPTGGETERLMGTGQGPVVFHSLLLCAVSERRVSWSLGVHPSSHMHTQVGTHGGACRRENEAKR